MSPASYVRAPRWRRTAAGLVDAAVFGGVSLRARKIGVVREGTLLARLLTPSMLDLLLGQQLRTPGQLMLGIRTVDRRNGARVALWRSLALAGAGAAGGDLVRRLAPTEDPARRRAQQALASETHEIFKRHPQASPEREAALREASARYPNSMVSPDPVRIFLPPLLVGLLSAGLRRRLAPTVEVLAREGSDHRP